MGANISTNGICVDIKYGGPVIDALSILVVVEQDKYEYEYYGPETHEAGHYPLRTQESIVKLRQLAEGASCAERLNITAADASSCNPTDCNAALRAG